LLLLRHHTTHSRDQVLISCFTVDPLSLRSLVVLKSKIFSSRGRRHAARPVPNPRSAGTVRLRTGQLFLLPARSEFNAAGMGFFLRSGHTLIGRSVFWGRYGTFLLKTHAHVVVSQGTRKHLNNPRSIGFCAIWDCISSSSKERDTASWNF
jgi:hypothetical protein